MINDVKKLSNEAPIILTWVPKVYDASLPDGKNSTLNYLEIIKDHKLKNEEERDIYLVINGPGFKQSQIYYLKRELEGIEGVHVVDLHQYDWSEIDTGWKIDGEDISIKDFFESMYNMTDEQRMYFAVEIDTFRLIALALVKQFTRQEGAIYIDFDSLKAINGHIGKDITIPEDILLGLVGVIYNHLEKKVTATYLNNDLIVTSNQDAAIDILSQYKSKMISQEKMCSELVKSISYFKAKLDLFEKFYSYTLEGNDDNLKKAAVLKEMIDGVKVTIESGGIGDAAATICKRKFDYVMREWIEVVKLEKTDDNIEYVIRKLNEIRHECTRSLSEIKLQKECLMKFSDNPTIKGLYEPDIMAHINDPNTSLNLAHCATLSKADRELISSSEQNKWKLFSFPENNGNYVLIKDDNDLSWMREDLYCKQQVSSTLEEVKVAMEKLSFKQL